MELQWLHRMPGGRLLWTDGESAYFARGMSYYRVDNGGKRLGRVVRVGSILEYLLSLFRLPRQLLRGGIHHLWPLQDGAALVVVRKRAYFVNATGRAALALRFPRGNKPAHKGVCVTPHGEVFLGEYALNFERKMPVTLYRSRDGGRGRVLVARDLQAAASAGRGGNSARGATRRRARAISRAGVARRVGGDRHVQPHFKACGPDQGRAGRELERDLPGGDVPTRNRRGSVLRPGSQGRPDRRAGR